MPSATGFGEAHFAGDVGAAMAARLDQLARDLAAVLEDVDDGAEPLGEAGFQAGVAEHEAQRLRQAAVDGLEVVLEGEIVGQVQLADARRVAAAAEILQQQRVVEFADLASPRPISLPIWMPMQQHRTQCPAGWPSVRSSAWLSAPSSSESVILSSCPEASGVGSMVETPDNHGRRRCRVASAKPQQITRGLTGCDFAGAHAQVKEEHCSGREMLPKPGGVDLNRTFLAMVVWIPPKCPAWRPNCLAIWVQQAQLGSAASLGGRS